MESGLAIAERNWWLVFAGFGAYIAGAGAGAHDQGVTLMGLGLVVAMLGEAINRPFVTKLGGRHPITGEPTYKKEGHPRDPRFTGNLVTGLGIGLSGFGLALFLGWAQI